MSTSITLNSCKIIKKFGIQIQAYIMIGLPGDTFDSSINTIKFVGTLIKEELIDVTHISTMVIYPGSVLYENSEKYNMKILNKDPNNYFMNCDFLGSGIPTYKTSNMNNLENYFNLYEELGLNSISFLNEYKNKFLI